MKFNPFRAVFCGHLLQAAYDHKNISGCAKVGVTLDGEIVLRCCFDWADEFKVPHVGFTFEMPEDEEEDAWAFGEQAPVCEMK